MTDTAHIDTAHIDTAHIDTAHIDTAHIDTVPGGPFLLHGAIPIRPAEYVYSEGGAPMTWSFDAPLDTTDTGDGPIALCRCGHSDDKPFCDGSHQEADWDASDAQQPETPSIARARRKESPEGTDFTMLDDAKLCMDAGLCGTEKRTVWQMMSETDDAEVRGTVIRMVEKCPSGRLSNVLDGDIVEQALPTEINIVPGGPLWVTGGLTVNDTNGDAIETRNPVTLCRCGASGNKPLCDGSHSDIDFDADA